MIGGIYVEIFLIFMFLYLLLKNMQIMQKLEIELLKIDQKQLLKNLLF